MRIVLWSFFGKNASVEVLLEEVEHSVAERCIDPTPMEPSVSYLCCLYLIVCLFCGLLVELFFADYCQAL
jgi:hypothetical protein